MKNKIVYIFTMLILLINCNRKQKQIETWNRRIAEVEYETKIVADTITNWQFYKDSELLFRSNISNLYPSTVRIKTMDNYESLILKISSCFNTEIMERKIKLILDKKILTTFTDRNKSHSPFKIQKNKIDQVIKGNIGKEIYINYYDSINKNGIIIGILEFSKE